MSVWKCQRILVFNTSQVGKMKYNVTWTETKFGNVEIEAETSKEAIRKWEDCEYKSVEDFSEVRYDDIEAEPDG